MKMIAPKHNVPVLRFPEFSGEWVEKRLDDIARFSKGKGISKSDIALDGATECIRYGQLYTDYAETILDIKSKTNIASTELILSEINDIIIPASGETQIDIATASCVLKSGVALGGDLNIIKTKHDGVFLSYYLNSKRRVDIARLSQGISVVHLYATQLKLLLLNIPEKIEQQKITSFLSSVDKKIEQLAKKKQLLEQYKKGMMQKLFSQQIRFKDENGNNYPDWEEKKIGDICEIKRGASPRPISSPEWFDDNSRIGWVRISDVSKSNKYLRKTTQYLSDCGVKRSRLVLRGNMIMSICATIGKPIYTDFNVCIHDGFIVFEGLTAEKEYLFYFLELIQKKWYRYGQPGTQVNLNSDIVSNEIITLPSNAEQTKIATFLSVIDDKINLTETELNKAKIFKKGLLQQMFV